ncbi:MAG: hypothetical protein WDN69_02655 [Aliidongia sp.]
MPPGLQWLRVAMERVFVDAIPDQHKGVRQLLESFPADVIVADDTFFGVLPMLLGPTGGTAACRSVRHVDPALAPSGRRADVHRPAARDQPDATQGLCRPSHETITRRSIGRWAIARIASCRPWAASRSRCRSSTSTIAYADAYMQLTAPSFEFPRDIPASVHFVGALPIIPSQAPLPPWAHELDGTRKVVLVTQGTVANHNFGLPDHPTMAALANDPDLARGRSPRAAARRDGHTRPDPSQCPPGQPICRSNGCCRGSM